MPRERLNQLLAQLQQELESSEDIDDEARERLYEVLGDIETTIDREHDEDAQERGVNERLDGLVVMLESNSPTTAVVLREIMATLARIGI